MNTKKENLNFTFSICRLQFKYEKNKATPLLLKDNDKYSFNKVTYF